MNVSYAIAYAAIGIVVYDAMRIYFDLYNWPYKEDRVDTVIRGLYFVIAVAAWPVNVLVICAAVPLYFIGRLVESYEEVFKNE
ncbi:MAG: hypothetical protein SVV03_02545 [Candidatus Nanohaloarchaea archaeon]|nr:hypothetical protein [Candidatus Nanohaloarchaea archaeon]